MLCYNSSEIDLFLVLDLEKVSTRRKKWYVLKNEKMEIECKASGLPDPTIKWQMANGGDLPKRFGVTGCCILQNNSTKLSDSGNYTCSASNKAGTQKQTIQIIVSSKFYKTNLGFALLLEFMEKS